MRTFIPPKFPLNPQKFPVFYGWPVLFFGTLGVIMSIPGQTIGLSVFTEDVRGAIGITLSQWTFAYMAGTFISGLIVTYAGKWYDKIGARVMATFTTIVLGLFLLYLSFIDQITAFLTSHSSETWKTIITISLLVFGFWGIRFFGQGMLTLSSRNMVMKWFDRFRGRVSIFLGLGTIIFFNSSPFFLKQIVNSQGWQTTWRFMALILIAGFAVLAFVFYRDSPESCNLKPDGPLSERKKSKHRQNYIIEKEYELKEARSTFSFWIFTLIFTLNAFYITGLTIQVENIFKLAGHQQNVAYSIFIPSALFSVVFSIFTGYISDKIKLKFLASFYAFSMALALAGMFLLQFHILFKWMIIGGMGIAGSLYFLLSSVTWPRFFGVKNLGAISGYSMSWIVIGSAIGPFFMAYLQKISGSYDLGTTIIFCIAIALGILALKTNNQNENLLLESNKYQP